MNQGVLCGDLVEIDSRDSKLSVLDRRRLRYVDDHKLILFETIDPFAVARRLTAEEDEIEIFQLVV
ncbi:MAG TPA: hypothetical protein VF975_09550 [Thermoanaerobaculia bacterium]